MHRFAILFSCVFLFFHAVLSAQESLAVVNSLKVDSVVTDTALSNANLPDTGTIKKDTVSLPDTGSLANDTVLLDSGIESQGTSLEADSLKKDESIAVSPPESSSYYDSVESGRAIVKDSVLQKESIKELFRKIRNIVRFFARYFLHFFLLIVSCGVIFYTVMFFQKKNDDKRFLTSTRLSVMDKQVQIAVKYMESNYSDPDLSVESICEALVTGPAFLEALFDRELGMNVLDFLTHIRINRVKEILEKEPDIPVEELISRIGYTDADLFLEHFKEINSIDFNEYHKSILSQNTI
jgi:AraC-like DNA-binding protein